VTCTAATVATVLLVFPVSATARFHGKAMCLSTCRTCTHTHTQLHPQRERESERARKQESERARERESERAGERESERRRDRQADRHEARHAYTCFKPASSSLACERRARGLARRLEPVCDEHMDARELPREYTLFRLLEQ
jgi:hypothetical protein